MSQLSRAEVETLLHTTGNECVSIYAPMIKAGPETQQNPIRFKNLLRQAEKALEERGMDEADAREYLEPAAKLIDDFDFWQHQSDGLAVFLADDFFRIYQLPLEVRELAVVEERFHLKPVLPLMTGDGRFYILALSQKKVRLFEASQHRVGEIDLGDLPTSLQDAVGYDVEEKSLQMRSQQAQSAGSSNLYHGHGGGGDEDVKEEVKVFLQRLARGISERLADPTVPVVLAGVDYLRAFFREGSDHQALVEDGIAGNPDAHSGDELHEKAWPLVEPIFSEAQQKARDRYGELAGTGQTGTQLEEVVIAADDGRVDTLFVGLGRRRWGTFERDQRQVTERDEQEAGTEDLVDLAAILTLAKSGVVFAVDPDDVPGEGDVAAIFRY